VHDCIRNSGVPGQRLEHMVGFPSGTSVRKSEHTKTQISRDLLQKPRPRMRAKCIKEQSLLLGLSSSQWGAKQSCGQNGCIGGYDFKGVARY
jgi:hypothetical protein